MSTAADRRMRGARNVLVDLLGIGEALPLRDLPVGAAPAIVPFGGAATVTIEDSEPGVEYRLRGQAGAPLPSPLAIVGVGDGGPLRLAVPKIHEPVTFTVEAARASGRTALLLMSAPVAIGLDSSIPAAVAGFDSPPVVVDFGASVTVWLSYSQEAVAYRLVTRADGHGAADDDLTALDTDIVLTEGADVRGTGGPISLRSQPLVEDSVVRVRLVKTFPGRRETQVSLLTVPLAIHVRADRDRPVAVAPPVVDHHGAPTLTVAGAQPGVRYALHLARIADADFDRSDPPSGGALSVVTAGGTVHVRPPALPILLGPLSGYAAAGEPKEGTGADLALPLPSLTGDSLAVVAATKRHGRGDAGFASAVYLTSAAAALVRPSASPKLRLEASISAGKLMQLRAFGGEPGVFYTISAAGKALGEFYMHQRDAADQNRNKGIGLLAVGIDLVIATEPTSTAPPPAPRLDVASRALPVTLDLEARRSMTGLTQPLAAKAVIVAPPAITMEFAAADPAEPARRAATVTIAGSAATGRHVLLVDGVPVGDPVAGTDGALVLTTGPLRAEAILEVLILDEPNAVVSVERRVAVPLPGS
jgi:hypothetical protein